MKMKIGKFEAEVPNWLIFLGILAGDNIYANHCNTKVRMAKHNNERNSNDQNDEESQQ